MVFLQSAYSRAATSLRQSDKLQSSLHKCSSRRAAFQQTTVSRPEHHTQIISYNGQEVELRTSPARETSSRWKANSVSLRKIRVESEL